MPAIRRAGARIDNATPPTSRRGRLSIATFTWHVKLALAEDANHIPQLRAGNSVTRWLVVRRIWVWYFRDTRYHRRIHIARERTTNRPCDCVTISARSAFPTSRWWMVNDETRHVWTPLKFVTCHRSAPLFTFTREHFPVRNSIIHIYPYNAIEANYVPLNITAIVDRLFRADRRKQKKCATVEECSFTQKCSARKFNEYYGRYS